MSSFQELVDLTEDDYNDEIITPEQQHDLITSGDEEINEDVQNIADADVDVDEDGEED